MRVLYALNCEHAEPREDGRLDVHGVFHELFAPGFPAKQDRMVLALGIEWDGEEAGRRDFRIDLLDPGGNPSLTIRGHTDVRALEPGKPPPRTVLVLPMEEVVFPRAGTYLFSLEAGEDGRTLAPLHLIEDPEAGG